MEFENNLSKKTQRVYDVIVKLFQKNGRAPTLAECAAKLGYKGPSSVSPHIEILKKERYLIHDPSKKDAIILFPELENRLSKKTQRVYDVIVKLFQKNGRAPTLAECAAKLGYKGPSSVSPHIEILKKERYLIHDPLRKDAIILFPNSSSVIPIRGESNAGIARPYVGEHNILRYIEIPIRGIANAGEAISYADEHNPLGHTKIKKKLASIGNLYAVKVDGNSMNRAKVNGKFITDGSLAIINPNYSPPANEGDIVLCLNENYLNIKKISYRKYPGVILLQSVSDKPLDDIEIKNIIDIQFYVIGLVIEVIKEKNEA